MSPEVTAAIIASSVGVLTLIGTLAAQYLGRRATSRDTQKALEEQRKQLDRTLAEQRAQTLNERFATAAEQLGSDKPAIRLAGVYAMAGLADDWEENRQTCVNVLCAYLRMPFEPNPGQDAPEPQRLTFEAIREVRHAVIKVISAHLKKAANDAAVSWQGLEFNFTGAIFDGGDFREAEFSHSPVVFDRAEFSGGEVRFNDAAFSGGYVFFGGAKFSGGTVRFDRATFSGSAVSFRNAEFSGGEIRFNDAAFSGGEVYFSGAQFSGTTVIFKGAQFSGGTVNFGKVQFSTGAAVGGAQFSSGTVSFAGASFSGSRVTFDGTQFSGGKVDFSEASDWSLRPAFPWTDTPPSGVKLPKLA
jgi:uncharacterized protein YjbI with pentapeptide repeats